MKILITGANGFIGAYITAKLISLGHEIVCAVRDAERTRLKFSGCKIVYCNFNTDHAPAIWNERLTGIDVLINAVGILQSKARDNIHNIHVKGTIALFEGAKLAGIKKIIHISALGIDDEKFTEYSASKREADLHLQSFKEIDWIILKPSLVYASGSFGGTTLLRALSVLPIIPLVGDGMQGFIF